MRVVITIAQLRDKKACPVYLRSPEWDKEREELVYADWDKTVARLSSTPSGLSELGFLVATGLVPMTKEQFKELRKARQ